MRTKEMRKVNAKIIRMVQEDEFRDVQKAIQESYFLAKHSWKKPLCDMAYDGLISGKWIGFGCFGENGVLMSYLDYKEHSNGEIEIGICLTREAYKGQGLAKLMLKFLMARYPDREITIGTYERNGGMICCIVNTGFEEDYRTPGDRIDGSTSIHYRYKPRKEIILDKDYQNKVILRKMKVRDLNGALQLWRSTPGVVVREYDDSIEGISKFLTRNPDTSLVLEMGEEIVGTLLCGNDGRRGFLYHFVVREDLREKGLGNKLLETVYTCLKKQGISKAGLVALQSNRFGLQFWTHNGWVLRDDLYYLDFPLCVEAEQCPYFPK